MNRKRILLVGDGNHQFIFNYAYWLKKEAKNSFVVDILSYFPLKEENKKYYDTIIYKSFDNILYRVISKIRGVRRYYRFYLYKKLISKLPEYDIIHFHFIGTDSYNLVKYFRNNRTSRVILSIWGSDMYRVNWVDENFFFQTCQYADVLTFTNQESIDYFIKKYNWKHNNVSLCRFGLAPLENLKSLTLSRDECKHLLSWNTKKIAITIGYNMAPAQQHLEILRQFEHESIKELADCIQLILPITYGGTQEYQNQLVERLNQLPFEYKIYDTFLSDEQVAYLRKASDIMIQLQITDQFSGSMQEHLYTNNIVITGSWLPYETMKEQGAWFIEIDGLDELSDIIPKVICKYDNYLQKTNNNPMVITELGSWEKNIHNWLALYLT